MKKSKVKTPVKSPEKEIIMPCANDNDLTYTVDFNNKEEVDELGNEHEPHGLL